MESDLSFEAKEVRQLVALLESGDSLDGAKRRQMVDTFERFECWNPYFRLVSRSLNDPQNRKMSDYVRLARVQNIYLENVFAAAETCTSMVQALGTGYQVFRNEILSHVVEFEDFAAEATILHAVWEKFPTNEDKVECLERLCMLYEKKTHNEMMLSETYERLIGVEPGNVKALRFFKMNATQNNDWDEAVRFLKLLLENVRYQQELYRVAQELAAIFLYQLDLPAESISVLDQYCSESPLDTSTIQYDAFHRLNNWRGCLNVLRGCLLNVDDDPSRSILHYKMGLIFEQLTELDSAFENYVKSAELWDSFLDPIEGLVNVAVLKKDWNSLEEWLGKLSKRVIDPDLTDQLSQAVSRVQEALEQVKNG